ncbi:MAG TPA: hypothetical protein VFX20_18005 [Steroidobacteraceae bacterium]|nr:hypothetical protein [Steroidobacteraceae bacterium]
MKRYRFTGHLTPTPAGMLPMQMSGEVYLASDVTRELIKLAAELVRGNLLPAIDTDSWLKTTPLAERRRITRAIDDAHERHKVLAMAIKRLTESEPDVT